MSDDSRPTGERSPEERDDRTQPPDADSASQEEAAARERPRRGAGARAAGRQPVVAAARRRAARGAPVRPVGVAGRHPRARPADHRARVRPLHRRQGVRHARREVLRRLPAGGPAPHLGRDRVRHRHHPAGRLLQDQRHAARGGRPRGHRRPGLLQEGDLEAQRHDRRRPSDELRRRRRHPRPLRRHPGRGHGDADAGRSGQGRAGGQGRPRGRRHPRRRRRADVVDVGRGVRVLPRQPRQDHLPDLRAQGRRAARRPCS